MTTQRSHWFFLFQLFSLFLFLTMSSAFAAHPDKAGSDPAPYSRMLNYYLYKDVKVVAFEEREFRVADKPGSWRNEIVGGRYAEYVYRFDETSKAERPSGVQIVRNYQSATTAAGGQVMASDSHGHWATLRFVKDGAETWVFVEAHSGGEQYKLFIVEKQSMHQDVVANAAVLESSLAASGHVEVPGIYFDFAKADVKPESELALKEVVKLLQANPGLNLWIVGHTDWVGGADSNVALSEARAAAVVKVLSRQMGVDSRRLAPFGAGPYAPVASNRSDDGRAKNRRVEIVEQP